MWTENGQVTHDKFAQARQMEARAILELIQEHVDQAVGALANIETLEQQVLDDEVPEVVFRALENLSSIEQRVHLAKSELIAILASKHHLSLRVIGRRLGLSASTVHRLVKEREASGSSPSDTP
jgi:DNA-directed RNA polymerase specialized sigma subunit